MGVAAELRLTEVNKRKILIDTSAWIAFLSYTESRVGNFVEQAIVNEQAVICGVVVAELVQSSKSPKTQAQLDLLFSYIEALPMDETLMLKAGIKLQQLRTEGVSMPVTNALVAAVAKEHDIPLLTLDARFAHLDVELIDTKRMT